ncbi:Unknown protein [Striga hermonthica]|uniref:Pectinesterase inhibitor domain-containing protein n=1 Tax=Striga hermonthica TaxID=68872 RepID=A0A9N7NI46_STRHE|nr:Unknown protein [Striga hermonthica]
MAFTSQQIIAIALIFTLSISPSFAHKSEHKHKHKHKHHKERRDRNEIERELRDLSSQTSNPDASWRIIKPELDNFNDTDPTIVTAVLLELAITRGDQIHDQLNNYHEDSRNDELKSKYLSCSKNYNDAVRNLNLAKYNLESENYEDIPIQIEDTQQELEGCRGDFCEGSFDPGHIGDRINEFEVYVDIVKVSVDRLLDFDSNSIEENNQ